MSRTAGEVHPSPDPADIVNIPDAWPGNCPVIRSVLTDGRYDHAMPDGPDGTDARKTRWHGRQKDPMAPAPHIKTGWHRLRTLRLDGAGSAQ